MAGSAPRARGKEAWSRVGTPGSPKQRRKPFNPFSLKRCHTIFGAGAMMKSPLLHGASKRYENSPMPNMCLRRILAPVRPCWTCGNHTWREPAAVGYNHDPVRQQVAGHTWKGLPGSMLRPICLAVTGCVGNITCAEKPPEE